MKANLVGLKELRENMDLYIAQIRKGKSFTVMRRSEPIFRVSPVNENQDQEVATISLGLVKRYRKALERLADA